MVVLWWCCGVSCCVVLCCLLWCGVVWCGVCVCAVWCVVCDTLKKPVCPLNTSPYLPTPRAHVFQYVRVVPAYTGTFWTYTRRKGGGRGVVVSLVFFISKTRVFFDIFWRILTGCWFHLLSPILLAMNGQRGVITCFRGSPKRTLGSYQFQV